MSFTRSESSASSRNRRSNYVCLSTVDHLSYTGAVQDRTRDAAQVVATGRRSWKTLKGEAIWPPNLEAALIQALEKYQPGSKKILGRFPMRNKFISDYIFEATGKRRTPKQVGSRLQQLRDTCRGKRILRLISRRHHPDDDSGSRTTSPSPSSTLSTPPPDSHQLRNQDNQQPEAQPPSRRSFIYVDILTDRVSCPSRPIINIVEQGSVPHRIRFTSLPVKTRHICASMDATVTFVSPFPLSLTTTFSVVTHGAGAPVHTEVAPLVYRASPFQGCGWVYSTTLAPAFWSVLCNKPDPSSYTILQDVIPTQRVSVDEQPHADDSGMIFTLVYRFEYPCSLSTSLAYPSTVQQCHAGGLLPLVDEVQSFPTAFVTSTGSGSDYDQTLTQSRHWFVDESSASIGECGMPRYLVGPDLSLQYSTEVTEHDFGSTICDLSYIYDTSPAMAMLSKSGRLAASSGPYNAETDVQLVSGNSWPADQPWPSSSTFYGHQSSLFLLSPTS